MEILSMVIIIGLFFIIVFRMGDFEGFPEWDQDDEEVYLKTLRVKVDNYSDDPAEVEELYAELGQTRFNPSSQPAQDAEFVFRKAKERLRQKRKVNQLPDSAQSFLRFKMESDGMSEADARKWVKKALKKDE